MDLINELRRFRGAGTEDELTKLFKELAPSFLYGGYLNVDNNYHIYIKTMEFYFHAEDGSKFNVKDPIVYHRNNRYVEGEVPYFPLMALHAHVSGYDITFENTDIKYRASALIREYEVFDVKNECFLVYDTKIKKFTKCKDGSKKTNTQSTYVYNFLNGFYNNNVNWVDKHTEHKTIKQQGRKNVYESNSDNNYEPKLDANNKKIKDGRQWSFTREDNPS